MKDPSRRVSNEVLRQTVARSLRNQQETTQRNGVLQAASRYLVNSDLDDEEAVMHQRTPPPRVKRERQSGYHAPIDIDLTRNSNKRNAGSNYPADWEDLMNKESQITPKG